LRQLDLKRDPLYHTLKPAKLLVLDEAHRLEEEIIKFAQVQVPKKKLKRYIPFFALPDHGYDVSKWLEFLVEIKKKIFDQVDNKKLNDEYEAEAETYMRKLEWVIEKITENPENWIVSEIKMEKNEIIMVELKPLDISPFCRPLFRLCDKTLMMSATILDKEAFCYSVGLVPDQVKFIHVGSDFPLDHRPIYPLKVEYLNYKTLNDDGVKLKIAKMVDKIMTHHKDLKGIIHTTSYTQLNFIRENVSLENKRRLLETNPEVERDEVITEHMNTTKPTGVW
jgi:ATP-dependent DNA helicase DinG